MSAARTTPTTQGRTGRTGATAKVLVASAALASVLAACGGSTAEKVSTGSSSTASAAKLRLNLNYVGTVEHYAPYYAKTEGLYDKAGLDVAITPGGDTPGQALLAAGQTDIAILDAQGTLIAKDKGEDVVAFASEFQDSPVSMTCRKDSGVATPADLKGKKLGLKSAASDMLPIILAGAGLTKSDVTVVPIGNQDLSLLIAGKVACMYTSFAFNEPASIEAAGVPVVVFTSAQLGMPAQANIYVTTRKKFDDPATHAALVTFVKTTSQAYETLLDDPTAAATYMIKHAFTEGLDIKQQTFQATTQVGYIANDFTKTHGLLALDKESWTKAAQQAQQLKLTSSLVDVTPILQDLTTEAGTTKR